LSRDLQVARTSKRAEARGSLGQASGQRVSTVSLALNGSLSVLKLTCGIAGNSQALVADAIESIGDVFSSLIVWGGLKVSARPADEGHPYGHGKAEPLAALTVAGLLIAAAGIIAYEAIRGIRTPHPPPAGYTLVVLIGVVLLKEAMYRFESSIGRRIGSSAILVDAWHHRSDALTSLAAGVGISVALIGGPEYAPADDWAALAACAIIVYNGLRFATVAILELMDSAPASRVLDSIRESVHRVDGAGRVETLLVRKAGRRLFVDLHLEVDPTISVRRGHEIAHAAKAAIMEDHADIQDVLIHIEPARARVQGPDGPSLR
jgi:cation diffusion facilitator family transporter